MDIIADYINYYNNRHLQCRSNIITPMVHHDHYRLAS
ncbi:hypothetical protein [Pectinatus frisingensis]